LITEEENKELRNLLAKYFKLANAYIKSIGTQSDRQILEEGEIEYLGNVKENDLDYWLKNFDDFTSD
jgi:hypothetical protein